MNKTGTRQEQDRTQAGTLVDPWERVKTESQNSALCNTDPRQIQIAAKSIQTLKHHMITLQPITLETNDIRLEPLQAMHAPLLAAAASDGEIWKLRITSVPRPGEEMTYIETALRMQDEGHRLAWIVRDLRDDRIVGSTSYHDIVPAIDRVEIGYTWYAKSVQRSHVNTTCKLLLLTHAFETLKCAVVGFRTDNFNYASQQAITRLGAKQDGVIRHHQPRRDGTVRDTVMFSIVAGEWPEIKIQLLDRLSRYAGSAG